MYDIRDTALPRSPFLATFLVQKELEGLPVAASSVEVLSQLWAHAYR